MSSDHPTSTLGEPPVLGSREPDTLSRPQPSAGRRRDKPQLSCNACRRRKSRCDRQQPCSACVSRGQTCSYSSSSYVQNYTPAAPLQSKTSPCTVPSLQDRLLQLERLVMSMKPDTNTIETVVPNHSQQPGPDTDPDQINSLDPVTSTAVDTRSECGSMCVSASEFRYVGGDHWAAILDSIADLKDHFDREEHLRLVNSPDQIHDDSHNRTPHALLLYGTRLASSRAEIIAALPPKSATDRYISRYFNRLDLVASSAVHGPSFLREYEAFWENPSNELSILWIARLFSMICLALLASDAADSAEGNDVEQQALQIDLYREKIVQCLNMGEYTKAGPYVLETMVNYLYIEFAIRKDADQDIWYLLGLEVNLAMRMGYHRDPSHFPGISPLHGEMRRRLWATVLLSDILISSQMGMPRMILDSQCDTAEPRNLNDTDLDEDTAKLPTPRPETENTTALGCIARRRMVIALGTISNRTGSIECCSYAEVMKIDAKLHDAAASIPPPLRMKPMAASVTDSPQIIMSRLFISHMFYRGQTMLHRRFLHMASSSKDEDSFAYSRNACLDASLGSLQIQHILDEETCPGGQLHTLRWRMSSIIHHQFLTATMILCSLLHRGQTLNQDVDIKAALHRARAIWMRRSSNSQEAKKAADTVSIVLAKAGESRGRDLVLNHESGEMIQGQYSSAGAPPAPNASDTEIGSNKPDMGQYYMGLYEPDTFGIQPLWGTFPLPGQQGQNFDYNVDMIEKQSTLEGWMTMNGSGDGTGVGMETDWS